jgi:phosphomannomutase
MERLYLFDIDGTLTPPRQKMDEGFAEFFLPFAKENAVYLVTGSDIKKVKEQIDQRILMMCRGIFACSGNEFWKDGEKIYEQEFYPSHQLVTFLEQCVKDSKFPIKTGCHIEHRPGMVNFSVVGRNADITQRAKYREWDERKQERRAIAYTILVERERFGDVDVSIGGEVSIDIYPRGKDKSQAVKTIRQLHEGLPVVFMGDKMGSDGNDYPAVVALEDGDTACEVENWQMTKLLIEKYWES